MGGGSPINRLDDPALGAWQGPGLSYFVTKFVSAQVEVGDGRDGLQRWDNIFLAETKHDPATVRL